ncbi:Hypothetical_protein [Hexamita inflata]|uniref:Hypothetical_protein n=1 Tax=Hexamita inflata TaxID=28002 RepID=A0AA86RB35_9EUKA|nr:Hypothetical protein HINF_LOCUS58316 [Hexamita inflata]
MQPNGHANNEVLELLRRALKYQEQQATHPYVVGHIVTPQFQETLKILHKSDSVYNVLKPQNKMILCRHHMLKRIFWSMHDAWLVFNVKVGKTPYDEVIDLNVIKDCIPMSKEALSGIGPSKLRDDIPTQCCNSQNAYKLINDGYLHEGLFFFLLTPLFIGLGSDKIDDQKYVRKQIDASVFCLYFYQFLYEAYTQTDLKAKNVGFIKGKFKTFQSVFTLEMPEQLIQWWALEMLF